MPLATSSLVKDLVRDVRQARTRDQTAHIQTPRLIIRSISCSAHGLRPPTLASTQKLNAEGPEVVACGINKYFNKIYTARETAGRLGKKMLKSDKQTRNNVLYLRVPLRRLNRHCKYLPKRPKKMQEEPYKDITAFLETREVSLLNVNDYQVSVSIG